MKARCAAGIDSDGSAGGGLVQHGGADQCRRRAEHVDGSTLGQWHLPDCGGAVTDQNGWESNWQPIFEAVAQSGERIEGWTDK